MPTLKYLLSQEGNDTFTAEKLGTLADMYEPNFYPDGRYKALTVTTEGPRQSKQAYKLGNQTKTFESSRKEDSLPTQAYEPKQGSRGVEVRKSTIECFHCKGPHLRRNCPELSQSTISNKAVVPNVKAKPRYVNICTTDHPVAQSDSSESVPEVPLFSGKY